MKKSKIYGACCSAMLAVQFSHASAQGLEEQIGEFIPGFSYELNFRYRTEGVDQDNALEDATASTLRSRLTLRAAPVSGLGLVLEADNVSAIGPDEYDSFALNEYRGTHSVVADPEGTEINQAAVTFSPVTGHSGTLGRQGILHANQRFVGGVGWRQNEQTYDGLSYKYTSELFDFDYSYLAEVHRIFGGSLPSAQITEFDSRSSIALGTLKQGWGSLSGFAYALDFENAAAVSSITYGASFAGTFSGVALTAALARQSEYADNPGDFSAGYLALSAARSFGPVRALIGYELLGSDDGAAAFSTPLATLHAFQGWADIFLNTPAAGIEDAYLSLSGSLQGVALTGSYHDFSADEGSADYGTELDIQASYTFNSTINAALKFASYDSDGFSVDTDKFWLTVNLNF